MKYFIFNFVVDETNKVALKNFRKKYVNDHLNISRSKKISLIYTRITKYTRIISTNEKKNYKNIISSYISPYNKHLRFIINYKKFKTSKYYQ